MRDKEWLENMLAEIWYRYFADVPQDNEVKIKFGQAAKTRLGSIKLGRKLIAHPDGSLKKRSIITITSLFKDLSIPDQVVAAVIAHELVHYAHGFSSPNPKLHRHPHQGGIVDKELEKRGLSKILQFERKWLKENWKSYLNGKLFH